MPVAVFPGIQDPHLKADITRWAMTLENRLPWSQGQYVTVVFTGANTDMDIPHTLAVQDPEAVRWIPVSMSAAAIVYQDTSATRLPWQPTHIWLRSSAIATVRLFLFIES